MRKLFSSSARAALALALALPAGVAIAQETTSSVRGTIVADGAPLEGAMITLTHVPSGTVSTTTAGMGGAFQASGLRPGGPYTVVVTAPGYPDATYTDISLTVGTPYNMPIVLNSGVEAVVITGRRSADALSSQFNRDSIEGIPSVARDIRDIARRDPFASFNPVTRGISIAGARDRTNRFSVDGVRFSDNFGLQSGGLPTARGPVPLDAIEQLSVKVAPYDVSEGDFQGGSINVVLRSGENETTGSAFYTYTNDSLLGDETRGVNTNLSLESKNWGAFLSGAIIKDKLFVALSYETLEEVVPANFGLAGSPNPVQNGFTDNGTTATTKLLTDADIAAVSSIAQSVYGYDTQGVLKDRVETDEKYTLKVDYNVTDGQRLSYTFIRNKGETIAVAQGSTALASPVLGLAAFATHEPENVYSHVLQLNSDWADNFSTELRVNYRKSLKVPESFGGGGGNRGVGFSQFQVCLDNAATGAAGLARAYTGNAIQCTQSQTVRPGQTVAGTARLYFGVDQGSQADVVGQEQYGAELVARYTLGNHSLKALASFARLNILNTFVQGALGSYYFDTVQGLQDRNASTLFLQGSITGNLNDVIANFDYTQYVVGLQDSWDVTDTLNISAGLRWDFYQMEDRSPLNKNFVNRYAMPNNYNLDGNAVVQPRIQATWRPIDNLTIRGGVGLFSGGSPDVFIGNSFSVAGVYANSITIERDPTSPTGCRSSSIPASTPLATAQAICAAALNGVTGNSFAPEVLNFLRTNTAAIASAPVNAMTDDFEVPAVWKTSLSFDYAADLTPFHLGDNWRFGADFLYSKAKTSVLYKDLRLTQVGTAPDGRPIYADTYTNANNPDMLLQNSDGGESFIWIVRASKFFDFGLDTSLSYTHQDVKSLSDMNGTTSSGTYGAQPSVDPNAPVYGISEYQIKHNIKASLDYSHNFFGDYATRIGVFGEYRTGAPYSLTMAVAANRNVFGVVGSLNRFLLYVPDVSSQTADPRVSYANAATYTAFRDFVVSRNLKQGAIIGKNTETAPDYFKVDLHLEQELPTPFLPDARIKVFGDLENLLNLIDPDYGSYRTIATVSPVVTVSCAAAVPGNSCPQYVYSNVTNPAITNNSRQGLWALRVGLRFEF